MQAEKEPKPVVDPALFGRLCAATVAHNNYYLANRSEAMYFIARHDVLNGISEHLISYYQQHRGTAVGISIRNDTYMQFLEWMKSEEFMKAMGPKYIFHQPYLVGNSWTPLRKDDDAVDVVLGVQEAEKLEPVELPGDVLDLFVKAFCIKFAVEVEDEVIVRDNTVHLALDEFRITVRLVSTATPPMAVRLTAALNQYDDFLDNFSPLLFFLRDWFKHVRMHGMASEQLAVPTSHTITCLFIHFLQFYEQIPQFFNTQTAALQGSNLLGYTYADIINYELPAYYPHLWQANEDFRRLRRDRQASIGELLIMFFFYYGHLVNVPYVTLILHSSAMPKKTSKTCVRLCVVDDDGEVSTEVPDAYRFQYLMRDAFQLIKDAQSSQMVVHRLMRMRMDESFNAMRDRLMRSNPEQCEVLEDAMQFVTEYMDDIDNHTKVESFEGFDATQCGNALYYSREEEMSLKKGAKPHKDVQIPQFSDEHHALKSYWKKPSDYNYYGKPTPMQELMNRAGKMFTVTYLPNPNNMSQLNVIFRPPQDWQHRLQIQAFDYMEGYFPEMKPVETERSFVELVKAACRKDMKDTADMRRQWGSPPKAKTDAPEEQENQRGPVGPNADFLMPPTSSSAQFAWESMAPMVPNQTGAAQKASTKSNLNPKDQAAVCSENQKQNISEDNIMELLNEVNPANTTEIRSKTEEFQIQQFKDTVSKLLTSFLDDLSLIIQPNVQYTGLDSLD